MDAHQVQKGKQNSVLSISLRPFQGNLLGDCACGRKNVVLVQIYAMSQKTAKLWFNFVHSHVRYQTDDISEVNATRKANKWFVSIQVLETTLLSNSRTLKKAVVTCDVFNNDGNLRAVYQATKKTTDFKTSR